MEIERNLVGEVVVRKVGYTRAVRRFVEKTIWRWVRSQGLAAIQGKPSFSVKFDREGSGHMVDCQLEIRAANHVWVGSSYGSGIQQALIEALDHMVRVLPPLAPPLHALRHAS